MVIYDGKVAATALPRPLRRGGSSADLTTFAFNYSGRFGRLSRLGIAFLTILYGVGVGLLAGNSTPLAVGLAGAPLFALLAWSLPRSTLVGSLFLTTVLNALLPFPVNPGLFAIAVLYVGVLIGAIKAPFRPLSLSSLLPFWFVAWQTVLWIFVALPLGTNTTWIDMAGHFVVLLAIPLAATLTPKTESLLKGIAIVGIVVTWFVFHPDKFDLGRPVAIGQNSNSLGMLCAQGAAAAMSLSIRNRIYWLLPFGWMAWGALNTGSRGGLIAVGCAVLIPTILHRRYEILGLMGVAALGVGLVFPSTFKLETLLNGRTERASQSSTDLRAAIAKEAINESIENPLIGLGPGRFSQVIQSKVEITGGHPFVTHNDYLGTAAESGLPSLTVLLSILLVPLVIARRDREIVADFRALSPQVIIVAVGLLTGNLLYNPGASLSASLAIGCLWSTRVNRSVARNQDTEPQLA